MKIVKLNFITGLFLIVIGLFLNQTFDIVDHDTYFVINSTLLFSIIGILFFLFGGILWLFEKLKRPINNKISVSH
jgi:heme/copper-type cytochrome/quinol oxidase subunit 1